MSRVAYVNGRYVPHGEAVVHIEDRGFQLADGIYEVWAVMDGRLADADGHFARLQRFGGNISRTANFVGMERSALHRKLKSLGV